MSLAKTVPIADDFPMHQKELYLKTIARVRAVLNDVDPDSHQPGRTDGAPVNKYNLEAAEIAAFLMNDGSGKDRKAIEKAVNEIWLKAHDQKCPAVSKVAQRLAELPLP